MKNTNKKMSQHTMILKHLRATKGLTLREALIDYSIQSFTKRISELRKSGYRIDGIQGKTPSYEPKIHTLHISRGECITNDNSMVECWCDQRSSN